MTNLFDLKLTVEIYYPPMTKKEIKKNNIKISHSVTPSPHNQKLLIESNNFFIISQTLLLVLNTKK